MADLSSTYMGVKLASPIIVGACGLTSNMNIIKEAEKMGAGAIVVKSLFEEQIELEQCMFDEDLHKYDCRNPEMINIFPNVTHQGPREHLMWVKEAKKSVGIPVFASLNAVNRVIWLEYARQLQETGVDGLEINLFSSPRDTEKMGADIESDHVELVKELKNVISVPIGVKLSSLYTNVLNIACRIDRAGADGIVLFNRLFEPDIDAETEEIVSPFTISDETDSHTPLRYTGLLEGVVKADLCSSTGIMEGEQVVKMILAGANAVQVVSALYKHGISHIRSILKDMEKWMIGKRYKSLADFRGKLSRRHVSDPWAYTRAQYARLLMNSEKVINNTPAV